MKGVVAAPGTLRSRLAPWAPALLWATAIFYFSAQSHPPQPPGGADIPFIDKLEHLTEYGIFGALLFLALRRTQLAGGGRPPERDAGLAVLIAALYGATDEVHQAFVPFRQADAADLAVDALAALLVVLALLLWTRRKRAVSDPVGKG